MHVVLIGLATLCGRIGPGITGSALDRRRLEDARAATDASLMGAGTLRAGDPEMRGPQGVILPGRMRAIITGSARIPTEGKALFREGPRPIVFTGRDQAYALRQVLGPRAEVVPLPSGAQGLSIRAACEYLASRGVRSLLIEGGSRLNYSALAEGVVDELLLTLSPRISGERGAPSLADGPRTLYEALGGFELAECRPEPKTGEVFFRYIIRKGLAQ